MLLMSDTVEVQVHLKSRVLDDLLTIGEVSRRSGVASSALRFYEDRGLITSMRAGSGHRRYPRPVLRRIAFIVFAQRVGLTLDGDRRRARPAAATTARRTAATGRACRAAGRGASTSGSPSSQRLRAGLTECIGCGCLSLGRCKLANPRDRAAGLGPGPRYWLGDEPLSGRA